MVIVACTLGHRRGLCLAGVALEFRESESTGQRLLVPHVTEV